MADGGSKSTKGKPKRKTAKQKRADQEERRPYLSRRASEVNNEYGISDLLIDIGRRISTAEDLDSALEMMTEMMSV